MRALVTNDDGISSEGLHRLARAAIDAGLDVTVAAPLQDSSGASASLTAVEADGRIVVEKVSIPALGGVPAYGVAAAPGFITVIAAHGAFGPAPDVVVSGINRGANTGNAILHSGTVGAAMTGRVHGCRALAVSLADGDGPPQWSTAARLAERALGWVLRIDDPIVINLNVPNLPFEQLRGIRQGNLAKFGTVQTTLVETTKGWTRRTVADSNHDPEPGSDAALLRSHFAVVTPLRPLCTVHDISLPLGEGEGADAWMESSAAGPAGPIAG